MCEKLGTSYPKHWSNSFSISSLFHFLYSLFFPFYSLFLFLRTASLFFTSQFVVIFNFVRLTHKSKLISNESPPFFFFFFLGNRKSSIYLFNHNAQNMFFFYFLFFPMRKFFFSLLGAKQRVYVHCTTSWFLQPPNHFLGFPLSSICIQ